MPAFRIALAVVGVLAVLVVAGVAWAVLGSAEPDPTSSADSEQSGRSNSTSDTSSSSQAQIVATPSVVREALDQGAVLLDVRTPHEFSTGHLAGARLLDVSSTDFERSVASLDRGRTYVVYCASGNRAGTAIETMTELGFDELINGGGFTDLSTSGLFETE